MTKEEEEKIRGFWSKNSKELNDQMKKEHESLNKLSEAVTKLVAECKAENNSYPIELKNMFSATIPLSEYNDLKNANASMKEKLKAIDKFINTCDRKQFHIRSSNFFFYTKDTYEVINPDEGIKLLLDSVEEANASRNFYMDKCEKEADLVDKWIKRCIFISFASIGLLVLTGIIVSSLNL